LAIGSQVVFFHHASSYYFISFKYLFENNKGQLIYNDPLGIINLLWLKNEMLDIVSEVLEVSRPKKQYIY
jgi:hypothetical protein